MTRKLQLGDDIDDYCVKCKRLTNHLIVAFVDNQPAKMRCRSCYHEHPYLREQPPEPKKAAPKEAAAPLEAPLDELAEAVVEQPPEEPEEAPVVKAPAKKKAVKRGSKAKPKKN